MLLSIRWQWTIYIYIIIIILDFLILPIYKLTNVFIVLYNKYIVMFILHCFKILCTTGNRIN